MGRVLKIIEILVWDEAAKLFIDDVGASVVWISFLVEVLLIKSNGSIK